ncbi:uncharacterized protein LOC118965288 [Oncorhynchus mykiss]|uniref:uncharacterized protein LOC118965288 n=1 Tax=Oncorhynchus mykiss TaxID=8022 RepID=UPI0018784BB4|nr:uncharacterized protein LOC118965288 [Oncorhynchus mykiss]
MSDHSPHLNLDNMELLFLLGKACPLKDLSITVDNSIVSPSQSAKNLGVTLDNTLSFSANIKAVTRSCSFMLYNILGVQPLLTQEVAQVLIQALVLSRMDYCNSLLAGLPARAIKPLQLIQNAASHLVFHLPKFSHVTLLLCTLHLLHVEACIHYNTMVLTYGTARGTAPPYLQTMLKPHTSTRTLHSATSGLLPSNPNGRSAPPQPSPKSSLSWHPNGGTSFTLKLGHQSLPAHLPKTSETLPLQTVS